MMKTMMTTFVAMWMMGCSSSEVSQIVTTTDAAPDADRCQCYGSPASCVWLCDGSEPVNGDAGKSCDACGVKALPVDASVPCECRKDKWFCQGIYSGYGGADCNNCGDCSDPARDGGNCSLQDAAEVTCSNDQ